MKKGYTEPDSLIDSGEEAEDDAVKAFRPEPVKRKKKPVMAEDAAAALTQED